MKIRQAKMEDAAIMADYNIALAKETENLDLKLSVVRPGVEAILRDSAKGIYFVAEEDGKVAGQLLVTHEWSDWRNGDFWWLQSVYIHPDFRSRGVFKALLDHTLEESKKTGQICGFRLYVETHNDRAQGVYHRLGFKKTDYYILERLMT